MPRLPDEILQSTVYLYSSIEDAQAGTEFGGTGFVVAVSSKVDPTLYMNYVVTNWHVAVRDGHSCIRVNKKVGGIDIFELDPAEWEFRPSWHDLAIAQVELDSSIHDVLPLAEDVLASNEFVSRSGIGPGDDMFMVGRFVDHDGGETNAPAVRFGNLSMMPHGVIKQPTQVRLESYLIDMHSRSGYSGSPVFVYRTHGSDFRSKSKRAPFTEMHGFCKLLGIHWGQFKEYWETLGRMNGLRVQGLSGMGCVIPASSILELLHCKRFEKIRAEADAYLARGGGLPPTAERN